MGNSIIMDVFLPIAVAFIMFGMGLGLTKQDFSRLWITPKPVVVGLLGQLIFLPLLAFVICISFGLSPALAVGMMILAASPGGTMSNVLSQLAKANLALSVTLTSICTLVCVASTPWLIHFSVHYFAEQNPPEYSLVTTSIGLIALTLVPVSLGIWIRQKQTAFAVRFEVYFRRFSLIFMICMIIALMIKERHLLVESFEQVFLACISLSFASVALGVVLAKLFKLSEEDMLTLAIEVGIQNATMAILIAVSFLHQPSYAITAGVYGLTMYLGPVPLLIWRKLKRGSSQVVPN